MTLKDRLVAVAERQASSPALWSAGESLNYAQFFAAASSLAAHLDRLLPPGAALGVHCERDRSAMIAILAATLSNRPYVALNPAFPLDRLRSVASLGDVGAIVCSPETQPVTEQILAGLARPVLLINSVGDVLAGALDANRTDQTGTAYLMFTSGTTGTPKGVRVLNSNLLAYLDGIRPIADLGPGARTTQFFDLSFDLSVHDMFVTWDAGAELNMLPKSQSMAIVDFARSRAVTSWFSVPSLAGFCDRLGQLTPGALPDVKTALFCGEPLPVSLARRFRAAAPNARIWNIYGPTEATIAFTAYEIAQPDELDNHAVVPLGRPIGDQLVALDGEGTAELLLGGSQVTPGYINAPDQNDSKFMDRDGTRFYRSGDVASWSDRHGIEYHGRIDDQVKINGYRVELLEIDAALRKAAGTPEVAAIPWPVSETGHADQVVGFVCGPKASSAEIRKACRGTLAPYMVPRRIVEIERMPLNASGKIDRRALRQMLDEEKRAGSEK
ncbi:MAG: AMP-binding protein [Paracoccaceae bacterium]